MPPVTVPFKWLVGVISGCAALVIFSCGVVFQFATLSARVSAVEITAKVDKDDNTREIIRMRDIVKETRTSVAAVDNRTTRMETILEFAFPKESRQVPKTAPNPRDTDKNL